MGRFFQSDGHEVHMVDPEEFGQLLGKVNSMGETQAAHTATFARIAEAGCGSSQRASADITELYGKVNGLALAAAQAKGFGEGVKFATATLYAAFGAAMVKAIEWVMK